MLELVRDDGHGLRPRFFEAGQARALGRVVAFGGGTGLSALLRGLRDAFDGEDADALTAVVTSADDGGSSGALRRAYGVSPPGDVRECLLALAADGPLASLFRYRFDGEQGGHNLGNLILTALNDIEQDFAGAVRAAGSLLGARGTVLPASPDDVSLLAEFNDGSSTRGESAIARYRRRVRRVSLVPNRARATPGVVDAIRAADTIVLGPGSLYTSLLPTLLVRDIATALGRTAARVVFVQNIMTEPGETDGYSACDHVYALRRHAPQLPIDLTVIVNSTPLDAEVLARYRSDGSQPVAVNAQALRSLGCRVAAHDLIADGPFVRHDPRKLAAALTAAVTERA